MHSAGGKSEPARLEVWSGRVVSQQAYTKSVASMSDRRVAQARGGCHALLCSGAATAWRGQPLAEIQAPAWLAAQQDYIALLESTSESAQPIRNAARERLVVLGVPEATIRALEKDRRAKSTTTVFAPIDGVLSDLNVRAGAAFMPGAPLFRINGLSTVWVNAQVPESQFAGEHRKPVQATATAWLTRRSGESSLCCRRSIHRPTLAVRIGSRIRRPGYRLACSCR